MEWGRTGPPAGARPCAPAGGLRPDEAFAVSALAAILAASAGWWALALWPAGDTAPEWLVRTRYVCFGIRESGVPSTAGWIGLVGSPLGMLGILLAGWPGATRRGLARLARSRGGRVALSTAGCLLVVGCLAAARQVAGLLAPDGVPVPPDDGSDVARRVDLPPQPLALTRQDGEPFTLDALRGRPAILTFAFGHCGTVCPLLVHDALAARDVAAADPAVAPAVVVVTLDPWRDTPARAPHIARSWGLGPDDHFLTGDVEAVEAVLDAWGVPRYRDPLTGDITHPALTYVIDASGRIAFATTGTRAAILGALERLEISDVTVE